MKARLVIFFLTFPFLLYAQSIKITTDKETQWSPYSSFEIDEGELVTVLKQEIDKKPILDEVRNTIKQDMESKGYTYVESDGDLLVSFTCEAMEITNVEEIGPLGQTPADQPSQINQSRTWSQDLRQGALAIDITEKAGNKSLWRASSTMEFGDEDLRVVFNGAAGKSLRKLPKKK